MTAFSGEGFEPYNAIAATRHLVHLVCWAHCRRYVFDALQALPKSSRTPDQVVWANASANLYSLLQTCKANGVNAYQYLRALLIALPKAKTADDYEALLPWNIALSKN